MTREIKFRAWDKENNKWIHDFRIHPQGMVFPAKALLDEPDGNFWLYERGHGVEAKCELSQYTGLKDKNGKEIYEGDVVKYKNMSGFDCGWEDGDDWDKNSDTIREIVKEVKFQNGEFYPKEEANIVEDGFYSWRNFDIEIIGNIYENPELINPKEE